MKKIKSEIRYQRRSNAHTDEQVGENGRGYEA